MSRLVRIMGRTKAYFMQCKQSMAPMPNPDWYEEKEDTLVNLKNLRKLPLSVHVEVWKTSWEWYKSSFEDSFAWGRRRKEDAKKQEAQEKMGVLQGMVKEAREVTHNTPEDLDKTKQAIKELLHEIEENKDDIKSVAQEKLDLIRVSLSAFSSGYREARDQEIKRVMAMDKSVLQSFLSERVGEVKHASSLLSGALLEDDARGTNASPPAGIASKTATPSAAAAAAAAGGGGIVGTTQIGAARLGRVTNSDITNDEAAITPAASAAAVSAGEEEEGDVKRGGEPDDGFSPQALLSRRARGAVNDLLHDPDIERLTGRAASFARGRLLQAEAAARVLKGEDGDGGGGGRKGGRHGVMGVTQDSSGMAGQGGEGGLDARESGDADARETDGGGGGGGSDGGELETPILSGLAKEARKFVSGKMGQAHDGAREVIEAAMDVRRSHRPTEEDNVDRNEGGAQRGKNGAGGVVDEKEGQGGSNGARADGEEKEKGRR